MRSLRNWSVLVVLAGVAGACDDARSPLNPVTPTPGPAPSAAPPSITTITPATGSTGGGTSLKIVGTGFQSGAAVSFNGTRVATRFDSRSFELYLLTPEHQSGAVDIVVTNPDRQSVTAPASYTFVAPESFSFNGRWGGYTPDEYWVEFTVQNDRVASFLCDLGELSVLSPPLQVAGGAFSSAETPTAMFSGRIVADNEAVGTISIGRCSGSWRAQRYNP
jgi:hypothetical protein